MTTPRRRQALAALILGAAVILTAATTATITTTILTRPPTYAPTWTQPEIRAYTWTPDTTGSCHTPDLHAGATITIRGAGHTATLTLQQGTQVRDAAYCSFGVAGQAYGTLLPYSPRGYQVTIADLPTITLPPDQVTGPSVIAIDEGGHVYAMRS